MVLSSGSQMTQKQIPRWHSAAPVGLLAAIFPGPSCSFRVSAAGIASAMNNPGAFPS
jgi:hypothetical protein